MSVRDATQAEILKGLTQPVVPLLCLSVLVLNTGLCTLASTDIFRLSTGNGLTKLSDLGAVMFAPVYAFLVIPAYLAGSEYASGELRVTLAAVPNRARLVAAKLAALVAIVVPGAVLVLFPGRLLLAVQDRMPLPATLVDLTRWTAAYVLMSCVAFSLATLLRSRIAPIAILVLVPLLLATGVLPFPTIIRLLPDQLSLSLLGTPGFDVTALPPLTAAALLGTWAVTLLAVQAITVLRRDS